MKEQSHKDEMSAAIRGDFRRLRDRGVAATLAPHDDDPPDRDGATEVSAGPLAAPEARSERSDAVVALEPGPGTEVVAVSATPAEPAHEPPARAAEEPRDADQPGFLARLFGR